MITANVQGQTLTLRYDDVISDSNRFLEIEFSFNEDWLSKTKVAVFKNGEAELQVVFIDGNSMYLGNDRCYVPSEVIKAPGFSVSIYGVNDNVVITTNEAEVEVVESGCSNLEPAEPTPTIWNQLLVCVTPESRCPSGGTAGQVLQKNSDDDYDMSWSSLDALITEELTSNFVPKTLKVNNKSLSSDISLDCEDIGAYPTPENGIPKEDLSSEVRASLSKADTALQEHQSLSGKQDTLQSGVNIKTLNNSSLLGSGNIDIAASFSPLDEVIWRSPKNFGEKVNGVVGDNIKVYRDITDSTLVFLGSGKLYGSLQLDDPYIKECICGERNTTVRRIFIQNGITSIGANLFNRFYSANYEYGWDKYWNVKNPSNNWNGVGIHTEKFILPASLNKISTKAFQYCRFSDEIVICCNGALTIEGDAFQGSSFGTISIPNATALSGYNSNTFSISTLKNFSISCDIESSISFVSSDKLTADSLINIANHLSALSGGNNMTLTLHSTAKTLCVNTAGVITDGKFVKTTGGSVTLTDYITNTKGWSIA